MPANDVIDAEELSNNLKDLPHWRKMTGKLTAVFQVKTSAGAIELFNDIAGVAQMDNHHPDVDWRYDLIFVSTVSHDVGGKITSRDIALASKISQRAQALNAKPRIDLIGGLEIAIDTSEPEAITSAWATGLGYVQQEDGSLADPHNRRPAIWFQQTETPNPNRLHLDVWTPYSESIEVLDKLASVNAQLDDNYAPSFVVATDSQGNRFCICTENDR